MPFFTVPIGPNGPVVQLSVAISGSRATALRSTGQGGPVLQPILLRGLIDSGADVTFIDTRHLPFLIGVVPAMAIVADPTSGAASFAPQYEVSLTILHPSGNRRSHWARPSFPVIDKPLGAHLGYEALIGRDVLDLCTCFYDGQDKRFTLGY
jgi:hypothetical protein